MTANYETPPSFKNRHGTFEIGTFVRFDVDREVWEGATRGDIRHRNGAFYIRTAIADLPIGPGYVKEDSIRLPD